MGSAIAALVADLIIGEPPEALHPVIWMGRWLAAGRERRTSRVPSTSLMEGALVVAGGVAATAAMAFAFDAVLRRTSARTLPMLRGLALKPALSLRPLLAAATNVQRALESHQLDDARRLLGRHLVSRDTSELSTGEVAGAAIESVAENLSDSVVAPLLAFRTGGLTGAYAYRMINTADAMFGYRTPQLEWFGKTAARTDDILNVIPARVTAALICCAAFAGAGSSRRAVSVAIRGATRTASPNAGWPMAAMAGALGVHLTKRDHYSLNDGGRSPIHADIGRACRIAMTAAVAAALAVDLT
jgi:adenosylcobinamide-phosphate synthase